MKNLYGVYKDWRKAVEEANEGLDEHIQKGSTDCGESAVREDFSNYAGLEKEISFENMQELEERYNAEQAD